MNTRRFKLLAIVLGVALALPGFGAGPAHAGTSTSALAGTILVKFKDNTPGLAIAAAHRENGGVIQEVIPRIEFQVVGVPAGHEAQLVAAYRRNPFVAVAEANGFYRVAGHGSNDPRVREQWQYNNTGQTGGTPDADIDAFEAWHVTAGSKNVAIAILDTGIDLSHEDLASKVVKSVNFTASTSADDYFGHGTHVAGIAAAATNNGIGVAGTCPKCVLFNVKVAEDAGVATFSAIANGIVWAVDNGADVINMSLGSSEASETIRAAVDYAWSKGAVLVGAAGNDGTANLTYPAAFDNVIAVAATNHYDQRWDDGLFGGSNYGTWVDVAAPGANILSTVPDHESVMGFDGSLKYLPYSGTSMAAPHVAGVAGLVWASDRCGTNSCVRTRIEITADPIAGTGTIWMNGRVNAYASVSAP